MKSTICREMLNLHQEKKNIFPNNYFKDLYIWNKLSLKYLFEQEPKNDTKIDILKLYEIFTINFYHNT